MKQLTTTLFHALPNWLRPAVASCYGYYVNRSRYGRDTHDAVQQAQEREFWDVREWSRYSEVRLEQILRHAATQVPYYREVWGRDIGAYAESFVHELNQWPLLNKAAVRQQGERLLADNVARRSLLVECTSGTTGTPLRFWQSKRALVAWYALFEARCRRWYGVSFHDRWAIMGGRLVVPVARTKPPFWVWNRASRQLYLSSYHLTPENVPHYLDALRHYGVTYMVGYPSALAALARQLPDKCKAAVPMKVIVSNAEPLLASQRRIISEAFQCPVRETYGMAEKVIGASECEAGSMHLWPEVGVLEVLQSGRRVEPGVSGDFVATTLLEEGMPLVRYVVGDRGILARPGTTCTCGRTLPIIESIAGRNCDLFVGRDGQPLSLIDPVPSEGVDVVESQIIQEDVSRVRVRCVPGATFNAGDRQRIVEHVRKYMGDVEVLVEAVPALERSANNKLQNVVCRVRQSDHV